MISLVQRKWCSQSACGTPRTQEITATGNGAAKVSTKSHSPISPPVAARSTTPAAIRSISSVRERTALLRNFLFTTWRMGP